MCCCYLCCSCSSLCYVSPSFRLIWISSCYLWLLQTKRECNIYIHFQMLIGCTIYLHIVLVYDLSYLLRDVSLWLVEVICQILSLFNDISCFQFSLSVTRRCVRLFSIRFIIFTCPSRRTCGYNCNCWIISMVFCF